MKKMMIMGGFMGFGIGMITGLVNDVAWPALFFRSCLAALFSGLLFRWWGQVWLSGLKESLTQAAVASKSARNGAPTK